MRRVAALLLLLGLAMLPARAGAQPLVADLSSHLIAITTGFAGTELLLYGAVEGTGDIVVVLKGPEADATIRRKDRIGGIWVNADELTFQNVPAFFRVASSKPLEDVAATTVRARHQMGLDVLRLTAAERRPPEELAAFRAGLLRNKERAELWSPQAGEVGFLGQHLFRTRIFLPANVPTGTYRVETFLLRSGQVVAAQTTPMFVSKVGLGAEIYDFAHRLSALYGAIAIAIAVLAGWLASIAFRRG